MAADSDDALDGAVDRDPSGGRRDPGAPTLSFPDAPRLELEQLLGQLIDRAQEVMATQGRLRGLLRANQLISGDLDLPAVLRRIVEAARELVGARYAGLGVLAEGGGTSEFVHTEMPAHVLDSLTDRMPGRPVGTAPDDGGPAVPDRLEVPIQVRGELFGTLFLAESTRGRFTAEDRELTQALAATAGVSIQNARLYESARSRGEWLQASAAVTRELLASDDGVGATLRLIAERTREIADADLVAVLLPVQPGPTPTELGIEVSVGKNAERLLGRRAPVSESLAGHAFVSGEGTRVDEVRDVPGWSSRLADEVDAGPLLAVPLVGSHRVHGVLWVARRLRRAAFTAADVDMAASFANHAAVAIELAQARQEQERASMLDERERIAADLHDHVIQRLFAAGLNLQSVAAVSGGPAAARLLATIEDLDDTIGQIRSTVFALHPDSRRGETGARGRLLDVISEITPALGFEPALSLSGLLDDKIAAGAVDDLLAVLREALTNVARHAGAASVEVDVVATADRLSLEVRDDGRGTAEGTGGTAGRPATTTGGLASLRRRAEEHGGEFAVGRDEPNGTRLTWSVPLC